MVIGSGISGACVARELACFRLWVAALEKGADFCAGATRGNSATVHSGHDAAYGTLKAKYNVLGNAMYDRLCREVGVPFRRNGTIVFAAGCGKPFPVRSREAIPKAVLLSCAKELQKLHPPLPIHAGDVVAEDVLGTKTQFIATRDLDIQ